MNLYKCTTKAGKFITIAGNFNEAEKKVNDFLTKKDLAPSKRIVTKMKLLAYSHFANLFKLTLVE